jgi:MFS family permease
MTRAWTGLPTTFWTLFVGVLLMSLATFVFPFLALFLRARGYSVEHTGLLVALFGAGSIPAGPVSGWLADRVGRRPTLIGALLLAAALTALLPFLETPLVVAAGTLALGLAVHAYFPAANAVVADVVRPDRYADAYGLMYWERNLGVAGSFALGGQLATFGYQRLFLADAATTFAFAMVTVFLIPETRPVADPVGAPSASPPADLGAKPRPGPRGLGAVVGDRHFRRLMGLNLVFLVGMFQFIVALPIVMARRGFTPAEYGRAMAVNGILIVLCQPWMGRVSARFAPAHALAGAALLVGAGYGGYAFAATPLQFTLATAVWSLGEIVTIPIVSALVAKLSPTDLRGQYQGVFGMSFGAALAIAPAVGGAVVERLGEAVLWGGVLATCLAVAVGHVLAGSARSRAGAG